MRDNQILGLAGINLACGALWVGGYIMFAGTNAKPIVDKAVNVMDSIKTQTAINDFDYINKSMKLVSKTDSSIEGVSELSDSLNKYIRQGTDFRFKETFNKKLETYIDDVQDQLEDIHDDVTPPLYKLIPGIGYLLAAGGQIYLSSKRT